MQTIITGAFIILFAVLISFTGSAPRSASTYSELEVIRHYQTNSVNHVAPAAKRLHKNVVLWLS